MKKEHIFLSFIGILYSLVTYTQVSFTNSSPITIPDGAPPIKASSYPSSIEVSGMNGSVQKLTVSIYGFTHSLPNAADILLVAPDGTNAVILSDVGGGDDVENVNITLDDAAATSLPGNSQLTSGTYKITNIGTNDVWPSPAPVASDATTLAAFNGVSADGTWRLYIVNDVDGSTCTINGGWSITITIASGVLPFSFSHFNASWNEDNNTVSLNWAIVQNDQQNVFYVETSTNGTDWNTIAHINPKNTGYLKHHQYQHRNPPKGRNYYRIKKAGWNTKVEYSKIIVVQVQHNINHAWRSSRPEALVLANNEPRQPLKVTVQLFDMNGKMILNKQQAGMQQPLSPNDISILRKGLYILKLSHGKEESIQKIVISI